MFNLLHKVLRAAALGTAALFAACGAIEPDGTPVFLRLASASGAPAQEYMLSITSKDITIEMLPSQPSMAQGGMIYFIYNGNGIWDEMHVFEYDSVRNTNTNPQRLTFAAPPGIKARILLVGGGGAGGSGGTDLGAGGGGGAVFDPSTNMQRGEGGSGFNGLGGAGWIGGRGSALTAAGGGGGASIPGSEGRGGKGGNGMAVVRFLYKLPY